ncbi:MAG: hypothetical protein ACKVOL_09410 [Novosphingobium sp.]
MSIRARLLTVVVSASVLAVNVVAAFPALAQNAAPSAPVALTTPVSPDQPRSGPLRHDQGRWPEHRLPRGW